MAAAETASHAAEAASHSGFDLMPVVVLLGAAVIAVPLFRRLGLGSVLGYLAAGLAIGPFGIGLFYDTQAILHVAELGVVMFLFIIGLEMQPSRLWAMRGEIFGLGLAQVGLCIGLLTLVGLALGYPVAQSFVAGTGFVLTSTAIVMQTLEERRSIGLPKGRRIVAILLLEDLAIVPLLALVVFLAPGGEHTSLIDRLMAVGIGLASIAGLVVAGLYLLDPLFRMLGQAKAREVMTAAALFVVLGAALAMQLGGLSMAMGAFLAGVLLSESSFRHQLEADVEPFRGILLGLFFLGVGMSLDLAVIAANLGLIAVAVAGYMIMKIIGIYAVARLFRASQREAIERAVLMAQGGEFAFVLYSAATAEGIINAEANALLTATIIVSMALTPLMVILHDRLIPKPAVSLDGVEAPEDLSASVLLIGFGRFGQIASQPLFASGYTVSIIETDTVAIRDAADFGFKVYYGDGSRLDILHPAGAEDAHLIIVAIDDREACLKIIELVKAEFPLVPVLAHSFDREHAAELVHAGVDWQIRETYESALACAERALELCEVDEEERRRVMEDVRRRDAERFAIELTGGVYDDAARRLVRGNAQRSKAEISPDAR
ncbi:monovalent cation:proton antiporter-2 (CPA2) family protein [Aminobacter sp. J44]|uniref:monovalent cation:proton antiporter-2 (CPA2) family protein n=1 Tax=Aminobacter sp. J44 TaxID=935262 RepID=UPI00119A4184|nr:monovalent cation:proton antiporter-2 (CPA2) family protein [Aminobacter sp. J44]TWG53664.1 CPA2 family monovalent cation:H+ antiporter-2/glutathione-regulated potassium-efflux system protein KefB [Aminobacter sp. J44]